MRFLNSKRCRFVGCRGKDVSGRCIGRGKNEDQFARTLRRQLITRILIIEPNQGTHKPARCKQTRPCSRPC